MATLILCPIKPQSKPFFYLVHLWNLYLIHQQRGDYAKQQAKYNACLLQCMRLTLAVVLLTIICAIPVASADNNTTDTIITVDSTNLRFSPSAITITEGDAVRFFWDGQILPHNAVEENETFDSGDTKSDEDYRFVFIAGLNGTFEYYCEPHRSLGMVGQIIVNPLPPVENNTTEEIIIQEMEDDESFMPFLSLPSITAAIAVAVLFKDEEESFE